MGSKLKWVLGQTEAQKTKTAEAVADLKALNSDEAKAERALKAAKVRRIGLKASGPVGWAFLKHNERAIEAAESEGTA